MNNKNLTAQMKLPNVFIPGELANFEKNGEIPGFHIRDRLRYVVPYNNTLLAFSAWAVHYWEKDGGYHYCFTIPLPVPPAVSPVIRSGTVYYLDTDSVMHSFKISNAGPDSQSWMADIPSGFFSSDCILREYKYGVPRWFYLWKDEITVIYTGCAVIMNIVTGMLVNKYRMPVRGGLIAQSTRHVFVVSTDFKKVYIGAAGVEDRAGGVHLVSRSLKGFKDIRYVSAVSVKESANAYFIIGNSGQFNLYRWSEEKMTLWKTVKDEAIVRAVFSENGEDIFIYFESGDLIVHPVPPPDMTGPSAKQRTAGEPLYGMRGPDSIDLITQENEKPGIPGNNPYRSTLTIPFRDGIFFCTKQGIAEIRNGDLLSLNPLPAECKDAVPVSGSGKTCVYKKGDRFFCINLEYMIHTGSFIQDSFSRVMVTRRGDVLIFDKQGIRRYEFGENQLVPYLRFPKERINPFTVVFSENYPPQFILIRGTGADFFLLNEQERTKIESFFTDIKENRFAKQNEHIKKVCAFNFYCEGVNQVSEDSLAFWGSNRVVITDISGVNKENLMFDEAVLWCGAIDSRLYITVSSGFYICFFRDKQIQIAYRVIINDDWGITKIDYLNKKIEAAASTVNISVLKKDEAENGGTGLQLATEAERELFFLTHREKVRLP